MSEIKLDAYFLNSLSLEISTLEIFTMSKFLTIFIWKMKKKRKKVPISLFCVHHGLPLSSVTKAPFSLQKKNEMKKKNVLFSFSRWKSSEISTLWIFRELIFQNQDCLKNKRPTLLHSQNTFKSKTQSESEFGLRMHNFPDSYVFFLLIMASIFINGGPTKPSSIMMKKKTKKLFLY